MKEKFKLTTLEKGWILYDVGNSAFILMVSTLIPIFFNALAASAGVHEDLDLSYWGVDEFFVEIGGMRRGEPDPFQTVDLCHFRKQIGKR